MKYFRIIGKSICLLIIISALLFLVFSFVFGYNNDISIKPIGKMLTPRSFHKVLLYDKDSVFVIGGLDSNSTKIKGGLDGRNAEIFNFNTGKSTLFPAKSTLNLLYSKIFRISDNEIALVDPRGFYKNKVTSGFAHGLEIFNIELETVKLLKTKPEKRFPSLTQFNSAILPNGNILVWGGKKISQEVTYFGNGDDLESINSFELYDIKGDSKKVYSVENLNTIGATFAPIDKNKILIVGGLDKNKNYVNKIRIFDLNTKKLDEFAKLNQVHIAPRVYIFNGSALVLDESKQVLTKELKKIIRDQGALVKFEKIHTLNNMELLTNWQPINYRVKIPKKILNYPVIGSVRLDDNNVVIFTYNNNVVFVNQFSYKNRALTYLGKYRSKTINPEFSAIDQNTILVSGGMLTNSGLPLSYCFLDQVCAYKQSSNDVFLLKIRKEFK